MALQNGGTDANGVVALNNVAGMDQYVTFGGRTLPPDEIAITTSFNSMQAAIANVSPIPPLGAPGDDGANITAALAKNAPVVLQKGATYNIATPINFSAVPGATLYGNGATLTGAMARTGGIANSVILAQPTLSGAGNTTLNGNAVIGNRTLVVTAGAGIPNGTFIQLQSAGGSQLTAYYLVISGGTTNTLTLDRPIQEPFLNADTVKPVSVMPRSCNVVGPLTINGNGDNGLSWAGMRRGYLRDIYVDVENAASGAACLVGGIDLDVGCLDVTAENCSAIGYNLAANADEFVVSMGMASCESCRFVRCSGRHATTAGIFLTSCYSCVVDQCEGTDCAGTAAGIALSGTGATGSSSTDCVVQNSYIGASAIGLGIALAVRPTIKSTTIQGSTTRAVDVGTGGTASTDVLLEDVSIIGGNTAAATGILTNAAVVRMSIKGLVASGIQGASVLDNSAPQFRMADYTVTGFGGVNALNLFVIRNTTIDAFFERGVVTMTAGTGGANAFNFVGAAGSRMFIGGLKLTLATNGDTIVAHTTNGITELRDVDSPTVVAGTFGYNGGAGTLLKRFGRVDMSGAATPYTVAQSDAGTFVVNGATGVDINYFDARAGLTVLTNIVTKGGTPNVMSYAIVAGTKVTMAGIAADTSTDGYRIVD